MDCVGGLGERSERGALRQMEAAGATLSSVASFLSGFVPALDTQTGRAVFAGLARFWSGEPGEPQGRS